jgi:hypothetical protein
MKGTRLFCGLVAAGVIAGAAYGDGFSWKDNEGKYLDLLYGGRRVTRYMYDSDESSEQRAFETYKVFHHVFDEDGRELLTNGPDGENPYPRSVRYPHHRGIFIGWSKLRFGGGTYDTWHMSRGVRQVHRKLLERKEGGGKASSTALVHWQNGAGTVMVEEKRTTRVYRPEGATILKMAFETELKAVNDEVYLGGDPEHAGFQYRAGDEVAKGPAAVKARYLFHREGVDPREDEDLPWVAMEYGLNGKRYTVVHINHPGNPKGTVYSAYRDYGRFGAFFKERIEAGGTLSLRYGVVVMQSVMPEREAVEGLYKSYVESVSR